MVRVSPLGKSIRKAEPSSESSGTDVSSAYRKTDCTIAPCEKVMYAGMGASGEGENFVEIDNPISCVKLLTDPSTLAFTDLSADTNQARTGTCSVTNRCNIRLASLGGIMLSLMAEECGPAEAAYWCKRLGFVA
jgi:hypothetical protein